MQKTVIRRNPLRDDTKKEAARVKALSRKIVEESPLIVKPYKNSAGRIMLNCIDPRVGDERRMHAFVVRDEEDWDDVRNWFKQPKKKDA